MSAYDPKRTSSASSSRFLSTRESCYHPSVRTSGATMRRREFIKVIGGAATWPLAAHAQQKAMPVIGIISARSRSGFEYLLNEFRLGLKDFGYVEGQTATIDYAFAAGRFDQLSQLASDLARRRVAVIISTGVSSGLAAKSASSTIP